MILSYLIYAMKISKTLIWTFLWPLLSRTSRYLFVTSRCLILTSRYLLVTSGDFSLLLVTFDCVLVPRSSMNFCYFVWTTLFAKKSYSYGLFIWATMSGLGGKIISTRFRHNSHQKMFCLKTSFALMLVTKT